MASSSEDDGKKGDDQGQGRLSAKIVCPSWKEKLRAHFKGLLLLPTELDSLVVDYAGGRYFLGPDLVRKFTYGLRYAIHADVLALYDDKKLSHVIHLENLLEHDSKIPLDMHVNVRLAALQVYHGINVIIMKCGEIVFQKTKGDKKEHTKSDAFSWHSLLTIAPDMSDNGLVWINDGLHLGLFNIGHMVRTNTTEVFSHIIHSGFRKIISASLNPAGTVLAYRDTKKKASVCHVECKAGGEIVVGESLTIEEHSADQIILLKNNVAAIVTKDREMFLHSFDLKEMTSKPVGTGPDCSNLHKFSYCAAEDIVAAFVIDAEKCDQGVFRIGPFFGDTQIVTICPSKAGLNQLDYKVSQDLGYLMEENRGLDTINVYRISSGHKTDE